MYRKEIGGVVAEIWPGACESIVVVTVRRGALHVSTTAMGRTARLAYRSARDQLRGGL
jgi:molybdopterin-binding protein